MSTLLPKPTREIDLTYRAWIITQPCAICGCFHTVAGHHWQEKGHGGKGTKCSDYRLVPLCVFHHDEVHRKGRDTFSAMYGINAELVIAVLNQRYADKLKQLKGE